ncbi:MAG: hypothetical protein ACEQSX_10080 [Baekduiaceae bacterium]
MRHRFTVEIDDDAWVGTPGDEAAVSSPMVMSIEVIDGDRDAFFELIGRPAPEPQAEEGGPEWYALEAVIGRVRRTEAGFEHLVEFVVRTPDGAAALWCNGSSWSEAFDVPNLEVAVESELGQFWADADTQELDMRADPDPPPAFWYGVDEASRAALAR